MFQLVQIVEQLFGVIRDFEVVHRDFAFFDQRARTPAAPVDDLLVGKDGLVDRVPVHRAVFTIHDAFFKQLGKQPLFPAVVFGFAGGDFAFPVNRKTQAFELGFHVFDVVVRPSGGGDVVFHRRVFRRHAERVPTHRLHDVEAV